MVIWDCNKSQTSLGYLLSGSLQTLYHHFNFALSLLLFKVSKPMSPQTASLHVLEEHPRIFFAPPKMMDSMLSQEWEIKPRTGWQRKTWSRTIDDIFHCLSLDKGEILDDMHEGNSSSKSFMACIEDNFREREAKEFGKGLDSKVKLGGRGNLRSICIAVVMRELDYCLSLDQEHMV